MGVLTMNTNLTISVLGLYNYDNDIFENMAVPENVDKTLLVDTILTECAELELLYPNSDFFKSAVATWSLKELSVWNKLNELWSVDGLDSEYDYRRTRTPNLSHSKTGYDTEAPTGTITDTATNNNTTTDSVSAYNSSSFENREQSVSNGGNSNVRSFQNYENRTTYNSTNAETGTETIVETGHKKPIAEIIKEASEIAINNIYDYITESFKERFCLMIY